MQFGIYSPNINEADVFHYYPRRTFFHREFDEMVKNLEEFYGSSVKAAIIPSSNQLPT